MVGRTTAKRSADPQSTTPLFVYTLLQLFSLFSEFDAFESVVEMDVLCCIFVYKFLDITGFPYYMVPTAELMSL